MSRPGVYRLRTAGCVVDDRALGIFAGFRGAGSTPSYTRRHPRSNLSILLADCFRQFRFKIDR